MDEDKSYYYADPSFKDYFKFTDDYIEEITIIFKIYLLFQTSIIISLVLFFIIIAYLFGVNGKLYFYVTYVVIFEITWFFTFLHFIFKYEEFFRDCLKFIVCVSIPLLLGLFWVNFN